MAARLNRDEISPVILHFFPDCDPEAESLNRFWSRMSPDRSLIYVSQCKPSSVSRGNWNYDFFHTIKLQIAFDVLDNFGYFLLIDYVNKRACLLTPADIGWLIRFSARNKSNEGQVLDVVIKQKFAGSFLLTPMDTHKKEERKVEVIFFG